MHEITGPVDPGSACHYLDTVALSLFYEAHDSSELLLTDERTDMDALILRPAELQRIGNRRNTLDDLIVDTALNEDA